MYCRRPRLRIAGRPASFHGTASAVDGEGSLPRPRTLRPPRQPSITDEDVEPVEIDANSYRHMVQDLTNFKTSLLRLKRVIQEVQILFLFFFLGGGWGSLKVKFSFHQYCVSSRNFHAYH